MKVYVLAPNEDWIVDRLTTEFNAGNADIAVNDPYVAETIWLFADWAWKQLPYELLRTKFVVTTVHHVVPEKWTQENQREFDVRDQVTNVYHVPNTITRQHVELMTSKPVCVIPYWINPIIWQRTDRTVARHNLKLPEDQFLIGSFQRDTEGNDLTSPKLEKGPDIFCDAVIAMARKKSVHVVLSGWRRQYVSRRLQEAHVKFSLFEKVSMPTMTQLYSALDLYIVSSRYEGGPQALIECAIMETPVISTPVGMAKMVLASESIGNDIATLVPNVEYAKNAIQPLILPRGFKPYRELFDAHS